MMKRIPRLRLGLVVASLLVGAFVFGTAAHATKPECKAINQTEDTSYNSNAYADPLGTAIAAATSGDTIKVIGTCYGNFVITKDLTLTGRRSPQQEDVIDGGGSGSVLDIRLARVAVSDLTITGGAIGIGNIKALVSLDRVIVRDNGLGVATDIPDASTDINDSVVSNNDGWGVWKGRGELSISNSRVTSNSGGGVSVIHGSVSIADSLVAWNTGDGGIVTGDHGVISNSLIEGNTSDFLGGGIFSYWRVEIADSIIRGNTASRGGGIYNSIGATLAITRSEITGNHAIGSGVRAGDGGGIFNDATLSLSDSSVTGNTASASGGGIFNTIAGTVTLNGTNSLCPNTPDDWPGCSP